MKLPARTAWVMRPPAARADTYEGEGTALKALLIDGQLVEAPRTTVSLNPTTGEVLGEAPDATVEQAEAAVKAARRAFDTTDWSTNLDFRVRCLNQLYEALVKHREELRELTIAEVG